MELLSPQRGNENPPFVNGGPANPQDSRDGSMVVSKVLENIGCPHDFRAYTQPLQIVNGSRLKKVSSRERRYTVAYVPMGIERRKAPFNGRVIRELRKQRHLSQDQLAELIGTKKANVSKWERATSYVAISFDLFANLAKAFYLPPETLKERLCAPPPLPTGQPPRASPAAPVKRTEPRRG